MLKIVSKMIFKYPLTLSGKNAEKTGSEKTKKNTKIQYAKIGNVFFITVLKTDFLFFSVSILPAKIFFFCKNVPKNTENGSIIDKTSAKILFKCNSSAQPKRMLNCMNLNSKKSFKIKTAETASWISSKTNPVKNSFSLHFKPIKTFKTIKSKHEKVYDKARTILAVFSVPLLTKDKMSAGKSNDTDENTQYDANGKKFLKKFSLVPLN